jgi:pimeloyl-ACP methyl ester carboxylesterase
MADPLVPAGAHEEHVEVSVGRLRLLRAGTPDPDATPQLLLHGGGYDNAAISWFHLYARFGADPSAPREVIGIDLPGVGGSVDLDPVGGPIALAAVVIEVMDALDLERAVVVGCSMGGDVALNLALLRPDRVAGLALIGPGGLAARVGGRLAHTASWLGAQLPDPVLDALTRIANRFARATLPHVLVDPSVLPGALLAELDREAAHPRAGRAYGRYNRATLAPGRLVNDLSGVVERIAVPALFVHGERDGLVAPEDSLRAAAVMPHARVVLLADTGHWAQLERPERFAEALQELLARVEG